MKEHFTKELYIPTVSVVLITYNQEEFIEESVNSILSQSFRTLELIIVNDGSTDKTTAIIETFKDDRIRVINKKNGGPSSALNFGIAAAKGEYIAIMAGDDVSDSLRIEKQLQQFNSSNEDKLVFSKCEFINNSGEIVQGQNTSIQELNLNKREDYLKTFFEQGNFLCAPSAFGPRSVFRKIGIFNPLFLQLQDFDYWLRAVISGVEFFVLDEKLVKYRVRDDFGNLSAITIECKIRTDYELFHVLSNFLKLKESDCNHVFCLGKERNISEKNEISIAKSFINHHHKVWRAFGLEYLYQFLQKSENESSLLPQNFHSTVIDVNFFNQNSDISKLYIDSGTGFSESQVEKSLVIDSSGEFLQNFELEKYGYIRFLRYDFSEDPMVMLRIKRITLIEKSGKDIQLELSKFSTNGIVYKNGDVIFLKEDPQMIFKIEKKLSKIIIYGERLDFNMKLMQYEDLLTKKSRNSLLVIGPRSVNVYQGIFIIRLFSVIQNLFELGNNFFKTVMKKIR